MFPKSALLLPSLALWLGSSFGVIMANPHPNIPGLGNAGVPILDRFIVGGEVVGIEKYPHQAAILWNGNYFCGGIILSDRWVLTAGHCVPNILIEPLSIRVGSSFHDRGGDVYNVVSNVLHHDFLWSTLDFDVSMLKTERTIVFSPSVQIAPISGADRRCEENIANGTSLWVSGFGETLNEGDDTTVLRQVEVLKIPLDSCREKYVNYTFPVNDNMICAGWKGVGMRDACQGDSGGALMNEYGCAVGVVSWGIGCAVPGYPGVYARISSVRDWIYSIMEIL